MKVYFETERFYTRDIIETDVQGIFELDSDPDVHIFLGNKPTKTMEEAEKNVQYLMEQKARNGMARLAIIEKGTEEFIGWTGIKFEENLRSETYYDLSLIHI